MYKYGLILGMIVLFANQIVFAQETELSISTSQETYYYGDFLTFTINVSEITGELATLYIIDEKGKSSSPIPLGITVFEGLN